MSISEARNPKKVEITGLPPRNVAAIDIAVTKRLRPATLWGGVGGGDTRGTAVPASSIPLRSSFLCEGHKADRLTPRTAPLFRLVVGSPRLGCHNNDTRVFRQFHGGIEGTNQTVLDDALDGKRLASRST